MLRAIGHNYYDYIVIGLDSLYYKACFREATKLFPDLADCLLIQYNTKFLRCRNENVLPIKGIGNTKPLKKSVSDSSKNVIKLSTKDF